MKKLLQIITILISFNYLLFTNCTTYPIVKAYPRHGKPDDTSAYLFGNFESNIPDGPFNIKLVLVLENIATKNRHLIKLIKDKSIYAIAIPAGIYKIISFAKVDGSDPENGWIKGSAPALNTGVFSLPFKCEKGSLIYIGDFFAYRSCTGNYNKNAADGGTIYNSKYVHFTNELTKAEMNYNKTLETLLYLYPPLGKLKPISIK